LDGVWGLIACFTTMEPILNGQTKNLNRSMANPGVGYSDMFVGKSLTKSVVPASIGCLPKVDEAIGVIKWWFSMLYA
jgi:hypothetical protein